MAKRFTEDLAEKISNSSPANQLCELGENIKELQDLGYFAIKKDITADATGGVNVFDSVAPFKFEIIDTITQARAASASGTVIVSDGTNDISDAMIMAVDKVVTRAGTVDDAYSQILEGGQLVLTTNGAADRGLVTILVIRID